MILGLKTVTCKNHHWYSTDISKGRVRSQKLWEQGLSGDPHHAKV